MEKNEKETDFDAREMQIHARMERLEQLEAKMKEKEKKIRAKENAKKQVLLRLSPSLWNELASWAEDEFRSINGQIEYLLSEAVRKHKNENTKKGG